MLIAIYMSFYILHIFLIYFIYIFVYIKIMNIMNIYIALILEILKIIKYPSLFLFSFYISSRYRGLIKLGIILYWIPTSILSTNSLYALNKFAFQNFSHQNLIIGMYN